VEADRLAAEEVVVGVAAEPVGPTEHPGSDSPMPDAPVLTIDPSAPVLPTAAEAALAFAELVDSEQFRDHGSSWLQGRQPCALPLQREKRLAR
jgi:hypothetical protein